MMITFLSVLCTFITLPSCIADMVKATALPQDHKVLIPQTLVSDRFLHVNRTQMSTILPRRDSTRAGTSFENSMVWSSGKKGIHDRALWNRDVMRPGAPRRSAGKRACHQITWYPFFMFDFPLTSLTACLHKWCKDAPPAFWQQTFRGLGNGYHESPGTVNVIWGCEFILLYKTCETDFGWTFCFLSNTKGRLPSENGPWRGPGATVASVCPKTCRSSTKCPLAPSSAMVWATQTSAEGLSYKANLKSVLQSFGKILDSNEDDACKWPGVFCEGDKCTAEPTCSPIGAMLPGSQYGIFIGSDVSSFSSLAGSLSGWTQAYFAGSLKAQIPPEVGNVTSLTSWWLTGMLEHGTQIPSELGKLQKLKVFVIAATPDGYPTPEAHGHGTMPASFEDWEQISIFGYHGLALSGHTMPKIDKMQNLLMATSGVVFDDPEYGELPACKTDPFPDPEKGIAPITQRLAMAAWNPSGLFGYKLGNPACGWRTGTYPAEYANASFDQLIHVFWCDKAVGTIPGESNKMAWGDISHWYPGGDVTGSAPLGIENTTVTAGHVFWWNNPGLTYCGESYWVTYKSASIAWSYGQGLTGSIGNHPEQLHFMEVNGHYVDACIGSAYILNDPPSIYGFNVYTGWIWGRAGANGPTYKNYWANHRMVEKFEVYPQVSGTVPPEHDSPSVNMHNSPVADETDGNSGTLPGFGLTLKGKWMVPNHKFTGTIVSALPNTPEFAVTANFYTGFFPNFSKVEKSGQATYLGDRNKFTGVASWSHKTKGNSVSLMENQILVMPSRMPYEDIFTQVVVNSNRMTQPFHYGKFMFDQMEETTYGQPTHEVAPTRWFQVLTVDLSDNPVQGQIGYATAHIMTVTTAIEQLATNGLGATDGPYRLNLVHVMANFGELYLGPNADVPDYWERQRSGYDFLVSWQLKDNALTKWALPLMPKSVSTLLLSNNKLTGKARGSSGDGWSGDRLRYCLPTGYDDNMNLCLSQEIFSGEPNDSMNGRRSLSISRAPKNALLTLFVLPPTHDPSPYRYCPENPRNLEAKRNGWRNPDSVSQHIGYQCTSLCVGTITTLEVDNDVVAPEALCRCRAGRGGRSISCTGCPEGKSSNYTDADDEKATLYTACEDCPANSMSTTVNSTKDLFGNPGGCQCKKNSHLYECEEGNDNLEDCTRTLSRWSKCVSCPDYMETEGIGARKMSECVCIDKFSGQGQTMVYLAGGKCGCAEGQWFNEAQAKKSPSYLCTPCSQGQMCAWSTVKNKTTKIPDATATVEPPKILEGYWAIDPIRPFAGHVMYLCNLDTCPQEPEVCATGRKGDACSECKTRHFGTPVGVCQPCVGSSTNMQIRLVAVVVICFPGFAFFHFFVKMTSEGNTTNLSVRALKMSFRQWVKYFQTLKIISVFRVSWPAMPRNFFDSPVLTLFSFGQYNGPLAVGCLGDQQTVELDTAFRLSLAIFIVLASAMAMVFSQIVGLVCKAIPVERVKQFGRLFAFGLLGTVKTFYVVTTFFFTALIQNGFILMMCRANPTAETGMSVADYPHMICDSAEWLAILPTTIIYLFVVGILFLCLGVYICKQQAVHLGLTSLKSRGQWTIISQDFRATHLYWPIVLQTKDIVLNIIAAVFGMLGDGMLQLVFAGALALGYGIVVLTEQPTLVFSCGVTEVMMSFSIFLIIFMTAATGLTESKGAANPNAAYEDAEEQLSLREHLMFLVQLLGIILPAFVVVVQLLLLRPLTSSILPSMLKPYDTEGRLKRADVLQTTLEDRENLKYVITKFDSRDFTKFNGMLSTSSATVGLLGSEKKTLHPSSQLRNVLMKNMPARDAAKAAGRTPDTAATISV